MNKKLKVEYQDLRERDQSHYRERPSNWLQFKALFLKNLSFQKRQTSAIIFQVFVPLIAIFLIWLINLEMQSSFAEEYKFSGIHGIPFFLNLPFSFFSQSPAYPISSTDCNIWVAVSQQSETLNKDILRPLFNEYCISQSQITPIFRNIEGSPDEMLKGVLEKLKTKAIKFGENVEGLEDLPDALLKVREISDRRFDLDVCINNVSLIELHRDNGFTK